MLRSSNIQNAQLDFNDNVYVDNSIVPDRIRTRSNDVLMCVRNGSKSLVGKTALISNEHSDLAWGAFMTVLRPNTNNTLLYHYLNSSSFRKQVFPDLETATVKQITMSTLNRITLFVPNTDEQNKISDFLSALDKRIEKQRQLIEALKSYKRGALSKLFPQNGETKPEYRFAGFTGPWEQRKLGELGEILTGSTPSTSHEEYYSDNGIPWVTPTDISENIIYDTQRKLSDKGQKIARIAPEGTILVTCIASIGKNIMLGTEGSFNQQINALIPNFEKNSPYFLLTESILWSEKMKQQATAGTMQIVNKTEFSELVTKVPILKEQEVIGAYFKCLDHLAALHQSMLCKYERIKSGLLQQLFI